MAVAVKNASEAPPAPTLGDRLPVISLLGMAYILGSIALVYYVIPALWWNAIGPVLTSMFNEFVSLGLELVVGIGATIGLVVLGTRLGGHNLPPGARAGIGICTLGFLAIGLIAWTVGLILQEFLPANMNLLGFLLMVGVAVGLLVFGLRTLFKPSFEEVLLQIEEQGWFSATSYKKSQGVRVRRGTTVGVLLIGGCGIYTLLAHHTLEAATAHWIVHIPFTAGLFAAEDVPLCLLRDIRFSVPLLLAAATLWLGWRIVNFPAFADFLIATEAEMNKVSWTTRKRLVQDTIVVLATVILLTVFLFVVDWAWFLLLSRVGVLATGQNSPTAGQQSGQPGQQEQPW